MHKAGFVSIVGKPNVGKSTFLNTVLKAHISIVTHKAQTTRHRFHGILNDSNYQIVFSDTPGMISPHYLLHEKMMEHVSGSFEDADVIIFMLDSEDCSTENLIFFDKLKNAKSPLIVLINKIDLSTQEIINDTVAFWTAEFPDAVFYPISVLKKFNLSLVVEKIISLLPIHPPYFPKDILTEKPERFIVNERIREKILINFDKEIPYAVDVQTDTFDESEHLLKLRTIIYVERESQKKILIGHQGKAIKKIGMTSRKSLESFFKKKIYLDLSVKVRKDWRNNEQSLKSFGYSS